MAEVEGNAGATLVVSPSPDGRLVVTLTGEIDILSVELLHREVADLMGRPVQPLVVDVRGLQFMDSSGIALLLRLADRYGPIEFRHPTAIIRKIIEATGLTEILRMEPPTA
jgi:anti-sigma B factor antagonist